MKNKKIQLLIVYVVLFLLFLDLSAKKREALLDRSWYINKDAKNSLPGLKKVMPEEGAVIEDEAIPLTARAACLMDANSKRVLYGKNDTTQMAMASTTKIMTLLVVLENADLSEIVTVSSNAARQPDVQLNIRTGEQYVLGDLLYSLMLESHNDTAVAIAEHVGQSVEGFAALMNAKARELGALHTSFVTPNGLDAEGHYTTAYDLSLIACEAVKNDTFVSIITTPSYQFYDINHKRSFHLQNKNRFLYLMKGAIGMKTGFTNQAGYCFVGAVRLEDRTLISTVLGSGWPPHKEYKWADTTKLMNYGIKEFTPYLLFEKMSAAQKGAVIESIPVVNGQKKSVNVALKENLSNQKILMRQSETITTGYEVYSHVTAPVALGTVIGAQQYYINGKLFASIPLITSEECSEIDYLYVLKELLKVY